MTGRFRCLLAVRGLSTVCTGLNTVVSAWLVLVVGGSAVHLALLAALSAGVGIPSVFFAGPLIDRFPRRATVVLTELTRVVGVAAVPLLAWSGELRLWHVLAAASWVSAVHAVSVAAYGALLPELLDRAALVRANGLWQAVSQVGVFVGAAVGGLAIPLLGDANSLLLEVAGRVLAGAVLLIGRWPAATVALVRGGFGVRDMTDTWRLLRDRPVLLRIAVFSGVPGSLIWGLNAVLPAFVKTENGLGAAEYGLIDAAWGAGAFVAGLLCARLPFRHEDRRIAGLLMASGAALGVFGCTSGLVPVMTAAAVTGGITLAALVLCQAYLQAESPPGFTGRVLALSQLMVCLLWLLVAIGVGLASLVIPMRALILCWAAAIVAGGLLLRALLRRTPEPLQPIGTKEHR